MPNGNPIPFRGCNLDSTYTLDKLVVLMRVRSQTVSSLLSSLRYGSGGAYGEVTRDWLGKRISDYHENLTIALDNGSSWYFGVQPNCDSPNEYWTTCKLEFNPVKVQSVQFNEFYNRLIANCKYLDFKRFDVAIDIMVPRENVMVLKDKRKQTTIEYSASNKTTYLGCRGQHGQVKIYNKQLEASLSYPMTRVEVTMDYENSSYLEFKRVFPKVLVLNDVESIDGSDLVLCLACREHDDYLRLLPYRRRKKIEALLEEASQSLLPDEVCYKGILSEILWYGKSIPIQKFELLEDDSDAPF